MGCGCEERARWIEARFGIPAPLQHLAVGVALAVGGITVVALLLRWLG